MNNILFDMLSKLRALPSCPPKGLGPAFGIIVPRTVHHWDPNNGSQAPIPI